MSDTLIYTINRSLYINLTQSCTLTCQFCPKVKGTLSIHDHNLLLTRTYPASDYISLIREPANFDEVVFCGFGEPTLRLTELLEIAAHIKKLGGRVRVNTDGLANLVHKRNVLPDMQPVVDALSVSMNAQDAETYQRHCHPSLPGSYEAMLDFLRLAPRYIASVTASAIEGLPGVDIGACQKIAQELGVTFRCRHLNQL
jgi:TatD family-associated radical SAM protein